MTFVWKLYRIFSTIIHSSLLVILLLLLILVQLLTNYTIFFYTILQPSTNTFPSMILFILDFTFKMYFVSYPNRDTYFERDISRIQFRDNVSNTHTHTHTKYVKGENRKGETEEWYFNSIKPCYNYKDNFDM